MTFEEYRKTAEGLALYSGITIDDSTVEAIDAWFLTRDILLDHFKDFYRRAVSISLGRYYELLRLETASVDWAVSQYLERLTETSGTESGTESATGSKTGKTSNTSTDTSTASDTTTRETSTSSTESGKTSESADSTTTSSTNGSDTVKAADKVSPQSIAYSGADSGRLPDLDWQYMSKQQQQETEKADESSSETQGEKSGTSSSTASGTGKETTTHTGNGGGTHTGSGETSETSTDTATHDRTTGGTTKEISTGRSGEPAEIFKRAATWIKDSSALVWLLGRLDPCFIMVYDND